MKRLIYETYRVAPETLLFPLLNSPQVLSSFDVPIGNFISAQRGDIIVDFLHQDVTVRDFVEARGEAVVIDPSISRWMGSLKAIVDYLTSVASRFNYLKGRNMFATTLSSQQLDIFGVSMGLAFPSSQRGFTFGRIRRSITAFNEVHEGRGIVFLMPTEADIPAPAHPDAFIYPPLWRYRTSQPSKNMDELTTYHNENSAARFLWGLVQEQEFRDFLRTRLHDVQSGFDVLAVEMYSKRKTCLGCMFTLIELKLRCAVEGIDLQLQFMGEVDPTSVDIESYKTEFVKKMENLIEKVKGEQLKLVLGKLIKQFVQLSTPQQRFEWLQRFSCSPLSALTSTITLLGHFP